MDASEQFLAAVSSMSPAATRDEFFRFIGVSPRSVDVGRRRHAEFMLAVAGVTKRRPGRPLSVPALVVRYLAPTAAVYQRVPRAHELLEEVADPYYRAHGYREVFAVSHDPASLSQLILMGSMIHRSPGFLARDGAARIPTDGVGILVDAYALAVTHSYPELARMVEDILTPVERSVAHRRADEYLSWEAGAYDRHLKDLADGYT